MVVAREPTAEQINARGIQVRSVWLGEFTARPRATPALDEEVDALLVATKAGGLDDALGRILAAPALIVPLLNGVDHMQRLRDRFGPDRVTAGVIRIESDRPAIGTIVQSSPSVRVDLATDQPGLRPGTERLADALREAGVPVRIGASEADVLWSKLVRLLALACTTSAADRPIGFIRSDPEWRAALVGAVTEAAAVAKAEGAKLEAADSLAELDEAHADLGSSMQRDIAAGREPELDAIAGAVLRAGARHGLECPTIAALSARIAARAGVPGPPPLARRPPRLPLAPPRPGPGRADRRKGSGTVRSCRHRPEGRCPE